MRAFAFAAMAALLQVSAATAQSTEITTPPGRPLAQGETPVALFPMLIEHSRHLARLENGRLDGEGGAFLRALGAQAHFVMIGEDHFNAGIAEFSEAYWLDLNEEGYQYGALEIDPWTASRLTQEVRAGGVDQWAAFLRAHGGYGVAPFVQLAPEARLATTILRTSEARRQPALWGLDQIFHNAGAWLTADLADRTQNAQARRIAMVLAAEQEPGWLGRGAHRTELQQLAAVLNRRSDREDRRLVEAMLRSQRVYAPFLANSGEAYLANLDRETLMKETFLEQYRTAARADDAPPRVMIKLGSNHIYRGPTPTGVPGFGGFVSEFAVQNGQASLSIIAICGPGGAVAQMGGAPPIPCTDYYNETWSFLVPFTDADDITIFDLRVWRLRLRRWAHLPADMRQTLLSYDIAVIVPNGPAADFVPGAAPPPAAAN